MNGSDQMGRGKRKERVEPTQIGGREAKGESYEMFDA
jgi:hypothetical protein